MKDIPAPIHTPGLIRRYLVCANDREVVVNEEWDLTIHGCPIVSVSVNPLTVPHSGPYIRQLVMTPEAFSEHFG